MDYNNFKNIIESILFVSGEPVSVENLSIALEISKDEVKDIMTNFSEELIKNKSGVRIIKVEDSYQLSSNPIYFPYIEKIFANQKKITLSESALEILAIIAYKQPVTKIQISEIRGVNSDYTVNKLIEYNLVCEKGRLDAPGRPVLFGTTPNFLKYYGLESISNIPDFSMIDIKKEANNEINQLKLSDF